MKVSATTSALVLLGALSFGADPKPPVTLRFHDVDYQHRWSKDGQNEFTPKGQEDLDRWSDMVTINVHDAVRDPESLASLASQVLEDYEGAGSVVKTDARPKDHPNEHFIAAVLDGPNCLEAAFARFLIVDGRGIVVVYSHRLYGAEVGPEMSVWLDLHGQDIERALMAFSEIPSPERLRGLPQSGE